MSHRLRSLGVPLVLAIATGQAQAATLTGSVSFENGLYTYRYELSNITTPVTQVLVLINSLGFDYDQVPVASDGPAGWGFALFSGYYFAETPRPDSVGLAYWGWSTGAPDAATGPLSGFSFTTALAPAANPKPVTYGLYSTSYTGGTPPFESFYLGAVVSPDYLRVTAVPEPMAAVLMLSGLAAVGTLAALRRKSRRA